MKRSEDKDIKLSDDMNIDDDFLEQLKGDLDLELDDIMVSEELIQKTLKAVKLDEQQRANIEQQRAKDKQPDVINIDNRRSRMHSFRWVKTAGAAVAACLVLAVGYQVVGNGSKKDASNQSESMVMDSATSMESADEIKATPLPQELDKEELSASDSTQLGSGNTTLTNGTEGSDILYGVTAGNTSEESSETTQDTGTSPYQEPDGQMNLDKEVTSQAMVIIDQDTAPAQAAQINELITECSPVDDAREAVSEEWNTSVTIVNSDGSSAEYEFGTEKYIRETVSTTNGNSEETIYQSEDMANLLLQLDEIIKSVPDTEK